MKIYLASRFERQTELRVYAGQLRAAGHIVTARWLVEESDVVLKSGWASDPNVLIKFAQADLKDIEDCDLFAVFTHDGMARGGMHVELGYALAFNKRVMVIGPRPTLFHFLPHVLQFDTWDAARSFIGNGGGPVAPTSMPMIIGVSGKKRAGKNTTFTLSRLLIDEDETGVIQKVGFADALKEVARADYGWNGLKDAVGRKLLQDLGLSKRDEDENYWVNKAMARIAKLTNAKIVFVTDVRFPNEADAIRKAGGVVWRVNRPSIVNSDVHVSETALDNYPFDYSIESDTLDGLFRGIKIGLSRLGLDGTP